MNLNSSPFADSYFFKLQSADNLSGEYVVLIQALKPESKYNIVDISASPKSAGTPSVSFRNNKKAPDSEMMGANGYNYIG